MGPLPQGAGALADDIVELHAQALNPLVAGDGVVGHLLYQRQLGHAVAAVEGLEGEPGLTVKKVGAAGGLVVGPLLGHLVDESLMLFIDGGDLQSVLNGGLHSVGHGDLCLESGVGVVVDGAADQGVAAHSAVLLHHDDGGAPSGGRDGGSQTGAAAAHHDDVGVLGDGGAVLLNGGLPVGQVSAGLGQTILHGRLDGGGGDGGAGHGVHVDGLVVHNGLGDGEGGNGALLLAVHQGGADSRGLLILQDLDGLDGGLIHHHLHLHLAVHAQFGGGIGAGGQGPTSLRGGVRVLLTAGSQAHTQGHGHEQC